MSKSGNGFIKGTVFGVLLGGLAALLLAPQSGKETQADLKRRARQTASDLDQKLEQLADDLMGRVDDLRDVAKSLKGEALEESQDMIRRAEVLKQDLRISAANLSKNTGLAKDQAMSDVKRMMDEGSALMAELERVTRHVARSAKDRLKKDDDQTQLPA